MREAGDLFPLVSDDLKEASNLLPSTVGSTAADRVVFGKGRYKVWTLFAILLLALWSMLAGIVTLRWSAGGLNRLPRDFDAPVHADLDILEMEERERVVRRMWDVYANNRRIRLPRFWQEAFEAAYEELTGADPTARSAAIAEIALMSVHMLDMEVHPRNHKTVSNRELLKELEMPSLVGRSTSSSSSSAEPDLNCNVFGKNNL